MITDDDGPYVPGEDSCSWIIRPIGPGASRIFLVISKLELGGLDSTDYEQLQIEVCQDMECSNPVHIPGSPFDQNSDYFSNVSPCAFESWMDPSRDFLFQAVLLNSLSSLIAHDWSYLDVACAHMHSDNRDS